MTNEPGRMPQHPNQLWDTVSSSQWLLLALSQWVK
jgi:hypothetical protein